MMQQQMNIPKRNNNMSDQKKKYEVALRIDEADKEEFKGLNKSEFMTSHELCVITNKFIKETEFGENWQGSFITPTPFGVEVKLYLSAGGKDSHVRLVQDELSKSASRANLIKNTSRFKNRRFTISEELESILHHLLFDNVKNDVMSNVNEVSNTGFAGQMGQAFLEVCNIDITKILKEIYKSEKMQFNVMPTQTVLGGGFVALVSQIDINKLNEMQKKLGYQTGNGSIPMVTDAE